MGPQNIYDKASFFDSYNTIPRNIDGLSGAYEWPTLRSLLGTINRTDNILDLGCGQGHFCRWAASAAGARSVHGIDISSKMLAKARSLTLPDTDQDQANTAPAPAAAAAERITYSQHDLTTWHTTDTYDLSYSCFAFHYLPHDALASVFAQIAQCLKLRGGRLVLAVEHPIWTAPSDAAWRRRGKTTDTDTATDLTPSRR